MIAKWNGQIIAESNKTRVVEGNHYFPPESVHTAFLTKSGTHTECPWKGTASYYHIEVEGRQNTDAAWYYPDPKEKARAIKGYIAFWRGVTVTD